MGSNGGGGGGGVSAEENTVAAGLRSLLLGSGSNASAADSRAEVTKFLPGRTCYVFDLDEEFGLGIPTTVSRSKTEYSQHKYQYVRGSAIEDARVVERIAGVLGYVTRGTKKKALAGKQR